MLSSFWAWVGAKPGFASPQTRTKVRRSGLIGYPHLERNGYGSMFDLFLSFGSYRYVSPLVVRTNSQSIDVPMRQIAGVSAKSTAVATLRLRRGSGRQSLGNLKRIGVPPILRTLSAIFTKMRTGDLPVEVFLR
jgi:hypothetical protein